MGVFEGQVLESIKEKKPPEEDLAQEMTQGLEMKFNKIAPLGKEDTAEELQDNAAKTQDTLMDAVKNYRNWDSCGMKTMYQLFDKLKNNDLPVDMRGVNEE